MTGKMGGSKRRGRKEPEEGREKKKGKYFSYHRMSANKYRRNEKKLMGKIG